MIQTLLSFLQTGIGYCIFLYTWNSLESRTPLWRMLIGIGSFGILNGLVQIPVDPEASFTWYEDMAIGMALTIFLATLTTGIWCLKRYLPRKIWNILEATFTVLGLLLMTFSLGYIIWQAFQ